MRAPPRLNSRLRESRPLRVFYAGAVGARILIGYRLLLIRKKYLTQDAYRRRLSEHHRRCAQWIYDSVLRLQGLMIKIGQTLGSRGDLLPQEYVRVLSRLQDQVPPRAFSQMRPHIERQLGRRISDVYSEFDPKPVAAASLAQVYKARLKDGRCVAVKVVYPNISRLVKTDLVILKAVLSLQSRFYSTPLEPVYRELAANIPHEVDMVHEAHNMEALAAQLSHRPEIIIPGVVWEHTRKRVLTMEYIDGIKITDLRRLAEAGIDLNSLVHLVGDVYMEQMLVHGHFHADPHPGNLFGLPGNRLAILDFGLTKRFSPQFQAAFRSLARSIFSEDGRGLVSGMKAAGFLFRKEDPGAALAMAEAFRAFSSPETYRDKELLEAVNDAMTSAWRQNPMVEMPGEITLAMRVLGLFLGLAVAAGADVDFAQTVLRHAEEPQAPDGSPGGGAGPMQIRRV